MKHGWKVSDLFARVLLLTLAVAACTKPAAPADPMTGTWVRSGMGQPEMTMLIEKVDKGATKLSYLLANGKMMITAVSAMDGNDATVKINGQPTDETMAITRVDKLNTATIDKKKGAKFAISKSTFSDDFKTLTVVTDYGANSPTTPNSKVTESWVRK
jgi:hypothetical protein